GGAGARARGRPRGGVRRRRDDRASRGGRGAVADPRGGPTAAARLSRGRRARAEPRPAPRRRPRPRSRARRARLRIRPPMRRDRLLVMLCVTTGLQTFAIGAFPALLPELGRGAGLADWQLGAVAGAFGFARMLTDLPAGLLMTQHVRRALLAAPVFVLAGGTCLVRGGAVGWRRLGRVLVGAGPPRGMA